MILMNANFQVIWISHPGCEPRQRQPRVLPRKLVFYKCYTFPPSIVIRIEIFFRRIEVYLIKIYYLINSNLIFKFPRI